LSDCPWGTISDWVRKAACLILIVGFKLSLEDGLRLWGLRLDRGFQAGLVGACLTRKNSRDPSELKCPLVELEWRLMTIWSQRLSAVLVE
jgi:hypothetical protein